MGKEIKTLAEWLAERALEPDRLVELAGLDPKVVRSILKGQYTPSPEQRRKLAAALGVPPEQVAWGHSVPVAHLYGHGPQFGRSP